MSRGFKRVYSYPQSIRNRLSEIPETGDQGAENIDEIQWSYIIEGFWKSGGPLNCKVNVKTGDMEMHTSSGGYAECSTFDRLRNYGNALHDAAAFGEHLIACYQLTQTNKDSSAWPQTIAAIRAEHIAHYYPEEDEDEQAGKEAYGYLTIND